MHYRYLKTPVILDSPWTVLVRPSVLNPTHFSSSQRFPAEGNKHTRSGTVLISSWTSSEYPTISKSSTSLVNSAWRQSLATSTKQVLTFPIQFILGLWSRPPSLLQPASWGAEKVVLGNRWTLPMCVPSTQWARHAMLCIADKKHTDRSSNDKSFHTQPQARKGAPLNNCLGQSYEQCSYKREGGWGRWIKTQVLPYPNTEFLVCFLSVIQKWLAFTTPFSPLWW